MTQAFLTVGVDSSHFPCMLFYFHALYTVLLSKLFVAAIAYTDHTYSGRVFNMCLCQKRQLSIPDLTLTWPAMFAHFYMSCKQLFTCEYPR